jgi:competence protein ComEC
MRRLSVLLLTFASACAAPKQETPAPAPEAALKPEVAAPAPTAVAPAAGPSDLLITFVDVDEGDAILIQAGSFDVLIDTGPEGAWDGQLENALKTVNGPLEMLFLTHPHEDHYGQAAKVLGMLDVEQVITSGEERGPPRDPKSLEFYEAYKTALAAKDLKEKPALEGQTFEPVPGVRFEVLATGGRVKDTALGSDINNDSLVLKLTFAGRQVMFAGDIEKEAGDWLVGKYCPTDGECPPLKSDVLKVPHHGSAHFSKDFFERVAPSHAIISAGFHNEKHCLPRIEAYEALRTDGGKVTSTSADGFANISVDISSKGTMTWTTPGGQLFVWKGQQGKKCIGPTMMEQE